MIQTAKKTAHFGVVSVLVVAPTELLKALTFIGSVPDSILMSEHFAQQNQHAHGGHVAGRDCRLSGSASRSAGKQ